MAAALRFIRLDGQSLWIDEILTWYSADVGGALTWRDVFENIHGPIYSLLVHALVPVVGDNAWALRLPAAVFGVAMVPAIAWLAARWLGPETAAPAAWLAACSPFLVWYGQEGRNYTLLMLWVCLAGVALLGMRKRLTAGGTLGYFGVAVGGLLSNLSFALLLPLHLTWWIGESGHRVRRAALLAAIAAGLLLVLAPWMGSILGTWDFRRLHLGGSEPAGAAPLRGATTFHVAGVPFALHAFAVGYTLGPPLRDLRASAGFAVVRAHALELAVVALVFGALGVLGLRAVARRGRLVEALLWLLVPVVVVSYAAARNFKVFHPRYLAVSLPAFLLVLAAGWADLGPRARRIAAVAVGALWAVSLFNLFAVPRYQKEDYRGAVALVRAHGVPGEKVLAVGAEDPVLYYYRGPLPIERFWLGTVDRPKRLVEKFDQAIAGTRGAWVVLSRPEEFDPGGKFPRFLAERFVGAETFERPGVRLWHIRPSDRSEAGSDARASDAGRGTFPPAGAR